MDGFNGCVGGDAEIGVCVEEVVPNTRDEAVWPKSTCWIRYSTLDVVINIKLQVR